MDKLKRLYKKRKELIDYLVFGVLTTAVNYIVFFILLLIIPSMKAVTANTLAWIVAFLFAYFTNRRWVFHTKAVGLKDNLIEFWWFFVARLFSLIVDDVIVYLGIDLMGQNKLLVKLISQVVIVIINYSLSKWIFKDKNKTA
ncbi:GtrA family protein [Xylocopilactobacillus apis]|uniref:Membrane protein n=1 Tax=Xylocopilactobacillus apis TaxID=2932183 RepID=A0AAU9CY94_9LACO|nr:GtrA family protein [Xylocopilactobacillus apis]BDR57411.1 membrane protein [Xylocopilactobacillus apis]